MPPSLSLNNASTQVKTRSPLRSWCCLRMLFEHMLHPASLQPPHPSKHHGTRKFCTALTNHYARHPSPCRSPYTQQNHKNFVRTIQSLSVLDRGADSRRCGVSLGALAVLNFARARANKFKLWRVRTNELGRERETCERAELGRHFGWSRKENSE